MIHTDSPTDQSRFAFTFTDELASESTLGLSFQTTTHLVDPSCSEMQAMVCHLMASQARAARRIIDHPKQKPPSFVIRLRPTNHRSNLAFPIAHH